MTGTGDQGLWTCGVVYVQGLGVNGVKGYLSCLINVMADVRIARM